MIKINLIRQKRKKRKRVNYDLLFFLSIIVFLVVLFSFHKTVLVSKVHQLENDVRIAKKEIARLKKQIGEVEKFKQKKKELQKKVDIVANLQKGRKAPVVVMDTLARAVPEKAWLTRLNYSGRSMEIQGFALNNYVVADFMNNLGATEKFGRIELQSAERNVVRGIRMMLFKIRVELKV
jgi:type IV pilus assembly protein PilN